MRLLAVFVISAVAACDVGGSSSAAPADPHSTDATDGGGPVDVCPNLPMTTGWTAMARLPTGILPNLDRVSSQPTSVGVSTDAVWTGRHFIIFDPTNGLVGATYDPCADSWSAVDLASRPAPIRSGYLTARFATVAGRVIAIVTKPGGMNEIATVAVSFDPTANAWSELTVESTPQADEAAEIVQFAATRGTVERDVRSSTSLAEYVVSARSIAPLPAPPSANGFSATYGAVRTRVGRRLVLWGGARIENGNLNRDHYPDETLTNEGWVYDAPTATWAAIPIAGAPSPRYAPTVLAVDHSLLVWGGASAAVFGGGTKAAAEGGAWLDLDTLAWRAVPTTGAPSPRVSAVAAWTGSRVVLYGGSAPRSPGASEPLTDGASLGNDDPAWTPLPTTAAPTATDLGPAFAARAFVTPAGHLLFADLLQSTGFALTLDAGFTKVDLHGDVAAERPGSFSFWTGRRLFRWGGTKSAGGPTGCEHPPPNVGCDPVDLRQYVPEGASLGVGP